MPTTQDGQRETPTGMGISRPNKVRTAVLADWESVRDSLPAPDEIWRWGDTDIDHKTLYTLKDSDLIVKVESEEPYWQTTATLWEYVNRTALPYENVGTGVRLDPGGARALESVEPVSAQSPASQAMSIKSLEMRGEWSDATVSTLSLTRPAGQVY